MNCVYNNEFAADRKHLKYLFVLHILFFSWGCGLCVVSCSKPYQPHEQVTFQNVSCEGPAKNVLPAFIAQICLETGATVCLSIPISVCGDHLPSLRAWSCKQVWQGAASECVTVHQLSPITSWLRGRSCPRPAGTVCRFLCRRHWTLQRCQRKSTYTVSCCSLADRRWCASYGFYDWIYLVAIEIIKDSTSTTAKGL